MTINQLHVKAGYTVTGVYAGEHFIGYVWRVSRGYAEIMPHFPLKIHEGSSLRYTFGLYTASDDPRFEITGCGNGREWVMNKRLMDAAHALPHWIAVLKEERDRVWAEFDTVSELPRRVAVRLEPDLIDLISAYGQVIRRLEEYAAEKGIPITI